MPFPAGSSSGDTPLAWSVSHLGEITAGFPPTGLGNQDSTKDKLDRLGNYPNSGGRLRAISHFHRNNFITRHTSPLKPSSFLSTPPPRTTTRQHLPRTSQKCLYRPETSRATTSRPGEVLLIFLPVSLWLLAFISGLLSFDLAGDVPQFGNAISSRQ
ncbi:hypothetical protein Droror1_Dr00025611 [Drosera rotundifolia]